MHDLELAQIESNLQELAKALGCVESEELQPFGEFAQSLHRLYEHIIQVLYPYLIPSFHPDEGEESAETAVLMEKGAALQTGIEWGDLGYLEGLLWPFSSELLDLLQQYYALGLYMDSESCAGGVAPLAPMRLDVPELPRTDDKRQLFWHIYTRIEQWRKQLFALFQSSWQQDARALPAFLELGRCLHGLLADCFLIHAVQHTKYD